MKNLRVQNTGFFSAALAVFILAEILFYQFYYTVPITLNNQKIKAKKGEPIESFLIRKNKLPEYGRLLGVDGKVLPEKRGGVPIIFINGHHSNLEHAIEANDSIKTFAGKDIAEPVDEKIEEVQSKLAYKGRGAFIYIIKRGRPGIRMIKRGRISNKTTAGKWLVTPQDFTIGRTNVRYKKVVALTFDDGPSKYTSLIMKILKQNKAKASFFVVGQMVDKRGVWLKEMAKRNYTIGNHTYNHAFLNKASSKLVKKELKDTQDAIFKASGVKSKWVRPPGGFLNSSAINLLLQQDFRIALWNIDTLDWQRRSPSVITDKILSNLRPGQVILMHDGGGNRMNTIKALPDIIKGIKGAGYRLVSLDDLYRLVE